MPNRLKFARCLRLGANGAGRDFVVGDLHGHRALFERALERLGFDPARDRVFSVGDLVDRGPDSLGTLALLEEPWFHAVLGNHELMLLHHLGHHDSRMHARRDYLGTGGAWIEAALRRDGALVRRLVERLLELPLVLHVDAEHPFQVLHGDLHPLGTHPAALFGKATVGAQLADAVTASRANIGLAVKESMLSLQHGPHEVRISGTPLGAQPITYAGHTPVRRITVHQSYVHIDQGICAGQGRDFVAAEPTVLEHQRFAAWLHGVVSAANEEDFDFVRLAAPVAAGARVAMA